MEILTYYDARRLFCRLAYFFCGRLHRENPIGLETGKKNDRLLSGISQKDRKSTPFLLKRYLAGKSEAERKTDRRNSQAQKQPNLSQNPASVSIKSMAEYLFYKPFLFNILLRDSYVLTNI